ncbi:MAG: hypothetical protein ACYDDB_03305 [bacterium]
MQIIPQIETPVSENYITFEENLIKLLDGIKNSGLNKQNKEQGLPQLILEQNFGINGLLLCKDLKERHGNIKIAYAFNMRDKNRISILSDLITLRQIDIKDIIVSEGVHPLKTVFNAAKPVYDIDILGLGLILKKGLMNNLPGIDKDKPDFFNFGAVAGANTPADYLKIKKLIKLGADRFIINYTGKSPDENIIKYIKSEKKEVFLYAKESYIDNSVEDFIKANGQFSLDGVIIKIIDEKANVFMQYKAI